MLSQYYYYMVLYPKWYPGRLLADDSEKAEWVDENENVKGTERLLNPVARDSSSPDLSDTRKDGRSSPLYAIAFLGLTTFYLSTFHFFSSSSITLPGRVLLDDDDICDSAAEISEAAFYIGSISAWVSGVLYFTARFPQIYTNWKRETTEGLALSMFALATTANIFYTISLVLPENADFTSNRFWNNVFPYLMGSGGTIFSTLPILWQFHRYKDKLTPKGEHTTLYMDQENGYIDTVSGYPNGNYK